MMFVIRWATWLLSVPVCWLGQLAAMVKLPLSVPLLGAAWRLGGNDSVGVAALANVARHASPEAARTQAARWMALRPQAGIAAMGALLAIVAREEDEAKQFLALGRELEPDRGGRIDLAEWTVVMCTGGASAAVELARKFQRRTDLSPSTSKCVEEHLLQEALLDGRFEEVESRAKRLWSIEDNALAATALWVLARRRGSHEGLDGYWRRLKLTRPNAAYLEILARMALGEQEAAERTLAALAELDPTMAEAARTYLLRMEPDK
jgi:hypothetical protein